MKERALEGLFHPLQECIWAGATAKDIRDAIAEMWAQIHRDEAKQGAAEIRGPR